MGVILTSYVRPGSPSSFINCRGDARNDTFVFNVCCRQAWPQQKWWKYMAHAPRRHQGPKKIRNCAAYSPLRVITGVESCRYIAGPVLNHRFVTIRRKKTQKILSEEVWGARVFQLLQPFVFPKARWHAFTRQTEWEWEGLVGIWRSGLLQRLLNRKGRSTKERTL